MFDHPPVGSPSAVGCTMKRFLALLAPYVAVTLFWCVWPNAWCAILAYHAQILFIPFWNRSIGVDCVRPAHGSTLYLRDTT